MLEYTHEQFREAEEANPVVKTLNDVTEAMVHLSRDGETVASQEDLETVTKMLDKYIADHLEHREGKYFIP